MRLEEISWIDVEAYLHHDDRLIFVLGSCEQHGYLSLLSDVIIPLALADAASQHTGVLVAPPLNFGVSPYFMSYPGTFSLRVTTFLAVVVDLVEAAYAHGFRRILVLNGHGGNDPARAALIEAANRLPGLRLAWYAWWTSHSVEDLAVRHQIKPAHANWLEAFPFTRVGELPAEAKPFPTFTGLLNAEQTRQVYEDGSFGGLYQVSDEVMQELFDVCLADILHLLSF